MHPKLIEIGSFFIPSYGFFVALGVFLALYVAKVRARGDGLEGTRVFDMGLTIVIAALVGSKLTLVLIHPGDFFRSFSSLINFIRSGGVFYGGFIGGVLAGVILIRKYRLPIWKVADAYGAGLPLGQAVGRVGCIMAGCCWGKACELPWAVTFTDPFAHEVTGVPLHLAIHPTQLYHLLGNLMIFFIVGAVYRRKIFAGQMFLLYAGLYAAFRFFIEFWRGDPRGFPFHGPLSTSQVIALCVFPVVTVLMIRGYRSARRKKSSETA